MNEPPPGKKQKRPHPLEASPPEPSEEVAPDGTPQRRVMLRIPVTKPLATYTLIAINVAIFIGAVYVVNHDQLISLYEWGANRRISVLYLGFCIVLLASPISFSTCMRCGLLGRWLRVTSVMLAFC